PELVEHGVSGLIFPHENSLFGPDGRPQYPLFIPPAAPRSFLRELKSPTLPYVEKIAERLAHLAENRDEYIRLSAGALERVKTGPFSFDVRRRRLASVYKEALA
ncbi:MAG: glycosyltransferase, partial [Acidimicrobiia bacterium]